MRFREGRIEIFGRPTTAEFVMQKTDIVDQLGPQDHAFATSVILRDSEGRRVAQEEVEKWSYTHEQFIRVHLERLGWRLIRERKSSDRTTISIDENTRI